MPTGWTPAAASSTLEEWTRTFSRGQQYSCYRTRNTFCRTRSLSNATFSFFDHVMKIWWFYTEIWRYIDFQNGGHPPSWNCFTTIRDHPRSPCQISCRSDTQIWRYSCLNFSHIWLEMPIQFPKIGVLGDFDPNCDYSSSRPPKSTSLRTSASFKLSTVKIRRGVWPVGELTESVMDTHTDTQTDRQTDRHTQLNLYSVHVQHWTDKKGLKYYGVKG